MPFRRGESSLRFVGLFRDRIFIEDPLKVRRRAGIVAGRFGIASQQKPSFGLGQPFGVVAKKLQCIGELPELLVGPRGKNSRPARSAAKQAGNSR